eukprot:TRINITY_DN2078_c0_g2_i1.p1 TRINITY_DN2078_c0_g2~~TRINITY_DN2078_c0_g2_i1.p1  ORF type:complete len:1752 (+),score=531.49 TRINITY_DN2078_c0_g2_i1:52-5307(+)
MAIPVPPGNFGSLFDAARQQTELVCWVAKTVQEHEDRLASLSQQLADQISSAAPGNRASKRFSTAALAARGRFSSEDEPTSPVAGGARGSVVSPMSPIGKRGSVFAFSSSRAGAKDQDRHSAVQTPVDQAIGSATSSASIPKLESPSSPSRAAELEKQIKKSEEDFQKRLQQQQEQMQQQMQKQMEEQLKKQEELMLQQLQKAQSQGDSEQGHAPAELEKQLSQMRDDMQQQMQQMHQNQRQSLRQSIQGRSTPGSPDQQAELQKQLQQQQEQMQEQMQQQMQRQQDLMQQQMEQQKQQLEQGHESDVSKEQLEQQKEEFQRQLQQQREEMQQQMQKQMQEQLQKQQEVMQQMQQQSAAEQEQLKQQQEQLAQSGSGAEVQRLQEQLKQQQELLAQSNSGADIARLQEQLKQQQEQLAQSGSGAEVQRLQEQLKQQQELLAQSNSGADIARLQEQLKQQQELLAQSNSGADIARLQEQLKQQQELLGQSDAGADIARLQGQQENMQQQFQQQLQEQVSGFVTQGELEQKLGDLLDGEVQSRLEELATFVQGELQTMHNGFDELLDKIAALESAQSQQRSYSRQSSANSGAVPQRPPATVESSVAGPDLAELQDTISQEMSSALDQRLRQMQADVEAMLDDHLGQTQNELPQAMSMLKQVEQSSDELRDRIKKLEDSASDMKKLRLQIPDMKNDVDSMQASMNSMVNSIDELQNELEDLRDRGSQMPEVDRRISELPISEEEMLHDRPAMEGAHAAPASPSPPPVSPDQGRMSISMRDGQKRKTLSAMLGSYRAAPPANDEEKVKEVMSLVQDLQIRLEKAEARQQDDGTESGSGTINPEKLGDMEAWLSSLTDRLKELETEYRTSSRKVEIKLDWLSAGQEALQADELQHCKTWNLANQVDVIHSVVQGEMKGLKNDVEAQIKKALFAQTSSSEQDERSPPLPLPARKPGTPQQSQGSAELEEKVKRIQDNLSQANTKIAALKTASKHAESQVQMTTDRFKKLHDEVDSIADQMVAQKTRLEYFMLHDGTDKLPPPSDVMDAKHPSSPHSPRHLKAQKPWGRPRPSADFSNQRNSGDANSSSPVAQMSIMSDVENNTSRIARLGKKLAELDGDVNSSINATREDLERVSQTLEMFMTFLPRKQRRILQKQMASAAAENDDDDPKGSRRSQPKVNFNERVETRNYHVEENDGLRWQEAGEPDVRWHWCYQPRHEFGRDLATTFQMFEDEREEFEKRVLDMISNLPRSPASVHSSPRRGPFRGGSAQGMVPSATLPNPSSSPGDEAPISPEDHMQLANIGKAVMPQLTAMEERFDRLSIELSTLKKNFDLDHVRKIDRDELQLLVVRLTALEKLDTSSLKLRIETLENDTKYTAGTVDDVNERLRRVERAFAPHSELVKIHKRCDDVQGKHDELQSEIKENAASSFSAVRKLVTDLQDVKKLCETSVDAVQKRKLDKSEFVNLNEKVLKLEVSLRDNRQILSESGGQEINAVVKRIILNMEDKIMVLERKIDALAESRRQGTAVDSPRGPSPVAEAVQSRRGASAMSHPEDSAIQSLGEEVAAIGEAMRSLKQDISVSRVHIDEISEQGQHSLELASRLHVLVESAGLEGSDDDATVLSLNRVQVMIAAAARQLVAGSKWVTKESFDSRFTDMRGEYLKEARQLNVKIEDVSSRLTKMAQNSAAVQVAVPATKLPKMLVQQQVALPSPHVSVSEEEPGTARSAPGAKRQLLGPPLSARGGARPVSEGRRVLPR